MNLLREIFKNTRLTDLFVFGGYSFYLVFGYMMFHSGAVLSAGGGLAYETEILFIIAAMFARIVIYILSAWFTRFFNEFSLTVVVIITATVSLIGFLITGMVFQFSSVVPDDMFIPWLLVGAVCLGCGDALITLLWARFSSSLTMRAVYLYVVICSAISLVFYFLVLWLPGSFVLPIAAVFFGVAVLTAKLSLDRRPEQIWEYSGPVFSGVVQRLWHPLLGTAIICFMAGFMLEIFGRQDIPLESFQQISLITSAIVVICLLLPALLVKKPLNIGRMYSIALPLTAAGFLLLPLVSNAAGGIVNSFAQLGAMVAGIILWCMLADSSHDTKLSSTLLFSLALAVTNIAQLAGMIVGFLNAETFKQSDLVLTTVAIVAVYLLLMVALFLFKDKEMKGETPKVEAPVNHEQQFFERCAEIAKEHKFTPRETDIFKLLAQGYTMPVISEKLFVSENTVKSHVKSIYQKLGIHVRAELIELVNAT